MSLPHLPLELKRRICQASGKGDQIRLTRVNSEWQGIAEAEIWRTVHLHPAKSCRDVLGPDLDRWTFAEFCDADSVLCENLTARITAVNSAIKNRPILVDYVEELSLTLCPSNVDVTAQLLHHSYSRIKSISVGEYTPLSYDYTPSGGDPDAGGISEIMFGDFLSKWYTLLDGISAPLQLDSLSLPVGSNFKRNLRQAFGLISVARCLTLTNLKSFSPKIESDIPLPSLSKLEYLDLALSATYAQELLSFLIDATTRLDGLRMTFNDGSRPWERLQAQPGLVEKVPWACLSTCKTLRFLSGLCVTQEGLDHWYDLLRSGHVAHLTRLVTELNDVEQLRLPLNNVGWIRIDDSDRVLDCLDLFEQEGPCFLLTDTFVDILTGMPHLIDIEHIRGPTQTPESTQYDDRTFYVIRSYTHRDVTLHHVRRSHAAAVYEAEANHYQEWLGFDGFDHQDDCGYIDATWYRGEMLPRSLLEEIYRAKGEPITWLEGGRNLELPDEVWTMLADWYEGEDDWD